MPGLNRTGPEGQGPGTGRRMGVCRPQKDVEESTTSSFANDAENPENDNFMGRGFGRGQGKGRGRGLRGGRGYGRGRGRGPASGRI